MKLTTDPSLKEVGHVPTSAMFIVTTCKDIACLNRFIYGHIRLILNEPKTIGLVLAIRRACRQWPTPLKFFRMIIPYKGAPFRGAVIAAVLAPAFFGCTTICTQITKRHRGDITSVSAEYPYELELPDAMVALGCAAVCTVLVMKPTTPAYSPPSGAKE